MARSGWSNSPTGFIKVVEDNLTDHMKTIALDAFGMLIRLSPVSTGAYRANHRLSISDPNEGYDENATGFDNEVAARQAIAALQVPYAVVYLQNNIKYGSALESGHSQQAPAGVYAVTANNLREKYGR